MKVKIDEGEFYPVYYFSDRGVEFDIPEKQAKRYKRVLSEWQEVQDELEKIYRKKGQVE
jgi:hypothetical protein